MGGSFSSNITNVQQQFMNNIIQQDQQNCISNVVNNANNNVTIITGSSIGGNFTGTAVTSTSDATCLMVSNMEDTVKSIISSIVQQTNSTATDWFNGFQITGDINSFDITQSITNNISQINQSMCQANITQSASNNYTYIANSRIGGDYVGVSSVADASANCSITNSMKNATYNQAQSAATQSNTIKGMFVAMAGAIAFFIGILVIGIIILYSTGAIRNVGKATTPTLSTADQELAAAQQLGLTPDILQSLTKE